MRPIRDRTAVSQSRWQEIFIRCRRDRALAYVAIVWRQLCASITTKRKTEKDRKRPKSRYCTRSLYDDSNSTRNNTHDRQLKYRDLSSPLLVEGPQIHVESEQFISSQSLNRQEEYIHMPECLSSTAPSLLPAPRLVDLVIVILSKYGKYISYELLPLIAKKTKINLYTGIFTRNFTFASRK